MGESIVVVTGGATGIGRAVAALFASRGRQVLITGRRADILERTATQIGATALVCDNAEPDDVARLAEHCSAGVDVLVNNAGGNAASVVDPSDLAALARAWQDNYTANVLTAVLTTTALGDHLVPGASVLTIGSIAAEYGAGSYGPAKAAVQSWTVALAKELGERGITVNAIAPGFIAETEFFGPDGPSEAKRASLLQATLTRRLGEVSDIAGLVAFLASPSGRHITGQTLHVNAGAFTTR